MDELKKYYETTFAVVVPWNKLYKREVIKTFFDEEVHFAEDELFGMANMFNAKKIVGINDVLYHYYIAPKETSYEESSTINKIGKQQEFWLSKDTYWYKRRNLLDKSIKILKDNNIDEETMDDFLYVRIFDFMVWELLIFNKIGADKDGIYYEIKQVFNEDVFKQGLKVKEKYGLSCKDYTKDELDERIKTFVDLCIKIADDCEKNNLDIKPFYACVNLFVKLFMVRNNKQLVRNDLLTNAYYEMENNSSIEAKYVNDLLK